MAFLSNNNMIEEGDPQDFSRLDQARCEGVVFGAGFGIPGGMIVNANDGAGIGEDGGFVDFTRMDNGSCEASNRNRVDTEYAKFGIKKIDAKLFAIPSRHFIGMAYDILASSHGRLITGGVFSNHHESDAGNDRVFASLGHVRASEMEVKKR